MINIIIAVSVFIFGQLFIVFLPDSFKVIYFLVMFPVTWLVSGFFVYRFFKLRKEVDKY